MPRRVLPAIAVAIVLSACQPLTTRPLTDSEIDAFLTEAAVTAASATQSAALAAWDAYDKSVAASAADELEALRNDALEWARSVRSMVETTELDAEILASVLDAVARVERAATGDDADAIVASLVHGHSVVAMAEVAGADVSSVPAITAPADVVDRVPGARPLIAPRTPPSRSSSPSDTPTARASAPSPPVTTPGTPAPPVTSAPSVPVSPAPAPPADTSPPAPAQPSPAPVEPAPAPGTPDAPISIPSAPTEPGETLPITDVVGGVATEP